jgi:hypothetical protein
VLKHLIAALMLDSKDVDDCLWPVAAAPHLVASDRQAVMIPRRSEQRPPKPLDIRFFC